MPCRYRIIGREASVDITSSSSSSSPSSLSTSSSSQSDVSSVSTSSSSHSSQSSSSSSSSSISTSSSSQSDLGPLLAFPGAVGFGRNATGGRGGDVYVVTKTDDDGSSGTLRHAVTSATGARHVVFNVAGNIFLTNSLIFNKSNMSIWGQTAPGDSGGIRIIGNAIETNASHLIFRFLTFACTDINGSGVSGISSRGLGNMDGGTGDSWTSSVNDTDIVIDHCDCRWGTDETGPNTWDSRGVTISYCMTYEPLNSAYHTEYPDHNYCSLHAQDLSQAQQDTNEAGVTNFCCIQMLGFKRGIGFSNHSQASVRGDFEVCATITYGMEDLNSHIEGGNVQINYRLNFHYSWGISLSYSSNSTGKAGHSIFTEFVCTGTRLWHGDTCQVDLDDDATHNPITATDAHFHSFDAPSVLETNPFTFPLETFQPSDLPGVTDMASLYQYVLDNCGNTKFADTHHDRCIGYITNRTTRAAPYDDPTGLESQDYLGQKVRSNWQYGGITAGAPASGEWNIDNATPTVLRIHETDDASGNQAAALATLASGHRFWLRVSAGTREMEINGTPTDQGSYWEFPVTSLTNYGTFSASISTDILGFDRSLVFIPEGSYTPRTLTSGVDNAWITAKGLSPGSFDHNANDLDPNYTNIEVYCHELATGDWI